MLLSYFLMVISFSLLFINGLQGYLHFKIYNATHIQFSFFLIHQIQMCTGANYQKTLFSIGLLCHTPSFQDKFQVLNFLLYRHQKKYRIQ